ncbi:MAG TPA: hypothetical protein VK484_11195 [Ferruginibacter sp.]|nr:hypothetical protein [Ferruginibacter sp.]
MIKLVLIPLLVMLSCGPTKTTTTASNDPVIVQPTEKVNTNLPDTKEGSLAALPGCIKNKIDSFKLKEQHEKPQRVVEYMYKGKKVYYVVMPCCDFFNEVFDANCKFLGAPDGGFTGRGDGKLPDFFTEAKNEKLIWGTPKEK